jgi:hypothetical protein
MTDHRGASPRARTSWRGLPTEPPRLEIAPRLAHRREAQCKALVVFAVVCEVAAQELAKRSHSVEHSVTVREESRAEAVVHGGDDGGEEIEDEDEGHRRDVDVANPDRCLFFKIHRLRAFQKHGKRKAAEKHRHNPSASVRVETLPFHINLNTVQRNRNVLLSLILATFRFVPHKVQHLRKDVQRLQLRW